MWGMHGWGLLVFVLTGFFVVAGAIVALLAFGIKAVGSAITGALEHNQRTCECRECTDRRYRAWQKAKVATGHSEVPNTNTAPRGVFISTARLEVQMEVQLGNHRYRVTDIRTGVNGYAVALRNLTNGRDSVVAVKFENADRAMWLPVGRWRRG